MTELAEGKEVSFSDNGNELIVANTPAELDQLNDWLKTNDRLPARLDNECSYPVAVSLNYSTWTNNMAKHGYRYYPFNDFLDFKSL